MQILAHQDYSHVRGTLTYQQRQGLSNVARCGQQLSPLREEDHASSITKRSRAKQSKTEHYKKPGRPLGSIGNAQGHGIAEAGHGLENLARLRGLSVCAANYSQCPQNLEKQIEQLCLALEKHPPVHPCNTC
jgi:hypothetical protein